MKYAKEFTGAVILCIIMAALAAWIDGASASVFPLALALCAIISFVGRVAEGKQK